MHAHVYVCLRVYSLPPLPPPPRTLWPVRGVCGRGGVSISKPPLENEAMKYSVSCGLRWLVRAVIFCHDGK